MRALARRCSAPLSAVLALLSWSASGNALILTAALLYVAGSFLVTMIFNVPLNNALAALGSASCTGENIGSTVSG